MKVIDILNKEASEIESRLLLKSFLPINHIVNDIMSNYIFYINGRKYGMATEKSKQIISMMFKDDKEVVLAPFLKNGFEIEAIETDGKGKDYGESLEDYDISITINDTRYSFICSTKNGFDITSFEIHDKTQNFSIRQSLPPILVYEKPNDDVEFKVGIDDMNLPDAILFYSGNIDNRINYCMDKCNKELMPILGSMHNSVLGNTISEEYGIKK